MGYQRTLRRCILHCVCHCTPPVIANCADECANFSGHSRKNTIPLSLRDVIIINVRTPSIQRGMFVPGKSSESFSFDHTTASNFQIIKIRRWRNYSVTLFKFLRIPL